MPSVKQLLDFANCVVEATLDNRSDDRPLEQNDRIELESRIKTITTQYFEVLPLGEECDDYIPANNVQVFPEPEICEYDAIRYLYQIMAFARQYRPRNNSSTLNLADFKSDITGQIVRTFSLHFIIQLYLHGVFFPTKLGANVGVPWNILSQYATRTFFAPQSLIQIKDLVLEAINARHANGRTTIMLATDFIEWYANVRELKPNNEEIRIDAQTLSKVILNIPESMRYFTNNRCVFSKTLELQSAYKLTLRFTMSTRPHKQIQAPNNGEQIQECIHDEQIQECIHDEQIQECIHDEQIQESIPDEQSWQYSWPLRLPSQYQMLSAWQQIDRRKIGYFAGFAIATAAAVVASYTFKPE